MRTIIDSVKTFYSLDELARVLGVHRNTVRNMMRRGESPPYIRLGKGYRFPVAGVERWLNSSSQQGK